MNQEINRKEPTNPIDQKEEKDFLAREEVKTMTKDMSKLRETEANRERGRVAEIKTAEEIVKEKEREKLARQAAVERDLAEKEAREREGMIVKIKEEREIRENISAQTKTEETEALTGEFRGALKETQIREEEARKRFLDRVAAKAEGREDVSAPSPPPALPVITDKVFLKKPSFGQKVWIRIVLSLLALSILASAATFWYLKIRETPPAEEPAITTPVTPGQKELVIPPALFDTENSQTLKFSQTSEIPFLLFQTLQSKTDLGSASRILLEDTANIEILELKGFFDSFNIVPPDGFYNKLAATTTIFFYSQEEGNRLGLAAKINNQEGLAEIMTAWEGTMEDDLQNLFELLSQTEPALYSYFRDAQYQGTDFRFQTYSRQDIGIVYAIYNDYFILTTSWKSMEKALDKLKEAPLSLENINLEDMSLAEKIGQLFLIGIDGINMTPETQKLIAGIQPGGVLLLKRNIDNETQTKELIEDLQQASLMSSGIPLLIGVDQEGGNICTINFAEEKTSQSAILSPEQAHDIGLSRGEELKELGINLNLAPVLDTAKSGDFLFSRSFQKDTSDASALAKALISGQKEASILTAIKHFPGYGDIIFDPEDKLAVLKETPEVSIFSTAAEAQPEFVMTSNVIYSEVDPNLPFSFSEKGMKLLKESVGEGPIIITDDLPQQSLIDKFSLKGVVTLPLRAGADMLTFSNNWGTTLQAAVRILDLAVRTGEISEARINASVLKIIKLKKAYYQYE